MPLAEISRETISDEAVASAERTVGFVRGIRHLKSFRKAAEGIIDVVRAMWPDASPEDVMERMLGRDWLQLCRIRFDITMLLVIRFVMQRAKPA